jgi:hypothetical protein
MYSSPKCERRRCTENSQQHRSIYRRRTRLSSRTILKGILHAPLQRTGSMKYSPLTKGAARSARELSDHTLKAVHDNPLKAPLLLRLPSPFLRGTISKRGLQADPRRQHRPPLDKGGLQGGFGRSQPPLAHSRQKVDSPSPTFVDDEHDDEVENSSRKFPIRASNIAPLGQGGLQGGFGRSHPPPWAFTTEGGFPVLNIRRGRARRRIRF